MAIDETQDRQKKFCVRHDDREFNFFNFLSGRELVLFGIKCFKYIINEGFYASD